MKTKVIRIPRKLERIALIAVGFVLMAAPAMAAPNLIDLFWWLRR